jgi:hypothetical protein
MGYWNRKVVSKTYPPATKCSHGWGCLVGIGGVGNVAMFYVLVLLQKPSSDIPKVNQTRTQPQKI